MSVQILTLVLCDGCSETYADGDVKQLNATKQRRDYKNDGWKHIGNNDYCPECLENKIKEKQNE